MSRRRAIPFSTQFVISFAAPTAILLLLSDESKLGPVLAMAIALLLPIGLEIFSLLNGRKTSWLSFIAVIGILSVGGISLLGLSEEWLAVRRSLIYAVGGAGLLWVTRFKPSLLTRALAYLIDMSAIAAHAKKRGTTKQISQLTYRVAVLFAIVLLLAGAWSYVMTLLFITAPTGSSQFNADYAKLRVMSLPYVSAPLLVATSVILMYFVGRIEKLTGLPADQLIKKRPQR